ncbi:hypothetical protein PT974_06083 [Cladobotryum mycophilum]|uniref:Uncharacterized protein n=1 Tax=Cladobotryum mycophilum TaxID=491253 RepID=A0ABR0SKH7_9HYPO
MPNLHLQDDPQCGASRKKTAIVNLINDCRRRQPPTKPLSLPAVAST